MTTTIEKIVSRVCWKKGLQRSVSLLIPDTCTRCCIRTRPWLTETGACWSRLWGPSRRFSSGAIKTTAQSSSECVVVVAVARSRVLPPPPPCITLVVTPHAPHHMQHTTHPIFGIWKCKGFEIPFFFFLPLARLFETKLGFSFGLWTWSCSF